MKFFYDGKTTWPDRGLDTEEYNEFRRREKASEKYHEINQQNWICKWILRFFLLVISISFVAFLLGDVNTALGILFILAIQSPVAGLCLYVIIKNKKPKRKLEFHISDDSLSAMYDWDVCKCRQCGGSDFAEIQVSESDGGQYVPLSELEEQIRKRDVVLHCAHHGNASLQCNRCGKWGYKKSDSTEPEVKESGFDGNTCEGMGNVEYAKFLPITNRDDEDQYVKLMEKLQAKHDELFEKIVFAQRDDKQDIAQAHASELIVVREMMNLKKHEFFKKLNI